PCLSPPALHGITTSANREFVPICGFTEEELIGQSHNIVRHPDMPPAAFASLWNALESGRSWMGMVKNRCKNGDHYWVSAFVTPILKDGRIVECQSVRTRPNPQAVSAARALYADLSAGRTPRAISRPRLGLFGTQLAHSLLIIGVLVAVGVLVLDVPVTTA